jgi:FKBP-type peptidyl-prolyl cis-trans isomerase
MKRTIRWTTALAGATLLTVSFLAQAQDEKKAPAVNLDSPLSQQSYAAGANIGKNIAQPGVELDLEALISGLRAAYANEELALSDAEMQTALMTLQQAMRESAQKKQAEAGSKAKEEGEAYLAANAEKEGVKVTGSGLQYKVISEGDGATPSAEDKVKVHYTGTFINGEKFDSSVDRGTPAEFGVGQVIAGWTEALQMMKVGSKWELAIPADLAYGPGRPGIPPNSVLLFEVVLLEIVK